MKRHLFKLPKYPGKPRKMRAFRVSSGNVYTINSMQMRPKSPGTGSEN